MLLVVGPPIKKWLGYENPAPIPLTYPSKLTQLITLRILALYGIMRLSLPELSQQHVPASKLAPIVALVKTGC